MDKIYKIKNHDFDGKYYCTRDGKIFSNITNKELRDFDDCRRGYRKVKLYDVNSKPITLSKHIIIAHMYVEGYEEGHTVNHEDGNILNNACSNLKWISNLDNIRHSIDNGLSPSRKAQLSIEDVDKICYMLFCENMRNIDVSRKLNISKYAIQKIKSRKNYKRISEKYINR